ncbi:MAG: hypothetical protein UY27_C0020G0012 [Candidatus Gottesmanbacteria bacterium GW2011_GWA1_48_13]|uniref:Extracellular solute-binding protein family 1 n=1 Tax=Candidatus Gottesmanbacteria bacterium GW2011_GWA1_48_13 TaxID=1618439 RepID=A0A0G1XLZ1_9BACT|nr:MAG: hypothetical protein UY27_C0020G0012 [Candidatus Gottesmanbacteria bacterium GW2011_GWA1_48_13]
MAEPLPSPDLSGLFNLETPIRAKPSVTEPSSPGPVMTTEVVPPPPPPAHQETVVIPGGVPSQPPPSPAPIQSGPAGGSLPRRLLMIAVFLLLVGGLLVGGRFVLGLISGGGEVTLTYWGLWENDAIIRPVIAKFEADHPKIKVQYVKQSPRQYRERLAAAIARAEGPDVFRFHNTWVAMLKNDLALVPSTVMTPAQFGTSFYPVAVADLVAGQNIFGIPIMIDGLGLYYNEDLFAAAGVTPPATWEEMLTLVPKLTVRNGDQILTSAIALGTTGNVENFSDIVATMMLQNGASLVAPTGTEAEEALIFYRKFASPSDPVYTWNDTLDNSVYAFATGKVAMILARSIGKK